MNVDWSKDWSQNWLNMAKGQDQMTKTSESKSEGIANCTGLNRGLQIINYCIYINIFLNILLIFFNSDLTN